MFARERERGGVVVMLIVGERARVVKEARRSVKGGRRRASCNGWVLMAGAVDVVLVAAVVVVDC